MHWFQGSIAEAVNLSKQKDAIFVVFIEDDSEQSTQMETMLDDAAVSKRLSDEERFLAVKLKSGSDDYTNFAKIYQLVPVPSLFFIGTKGIPLEVVCEGMQAQYLATRIDRIVSTHYLDRKPPVGASSSSKSLKEQSASLLQAEASAGSKHCATDQQPESSSASQPKVAKTSDHREVTTKSGMEYEVVCDGDVCTRVPKRGADDPGPSSRVEIPPVSLLDNLVKIPPASAPDSLPAGAPVSVPASTPAAQAPKPEPPSAPAEESAEDIAERMERAKELIEARRREKAEKEKEEERVRELERRTAGQGVAELKRWQADQELKQIQEERKREKMENSLARQRVLDQIAQDRAERRARDQPRDVTAAGPVSPQPPVTLPTSGDVSVGARIHLKLPDGSSHTSHFQADDTLADVRRYVADNLQLSESSFSLWTAFPRRELSEDSATLRALQLAPSAALLVLRSRPRALAHSSPFHNVIAFLTQLFTSMVVAPTSQFYNWIRSYLYPANADRAASPPRTGGNRGPSPPGGVRRRGNVHRLPGEMSGDDDNNTWNGNSTQQM